MLSSLWRFLHSSGILFITDLTYSHENHKNLCGNAASKDIEFKTHLHLQMLQMKNNTVFDNLLQLWILDGIFMRSLSIYDCNASRYTTLWLLTWSLLLKLNILENCEQWLKWKMTARLSLSQSGSQDHRPILKGQNKTLLSLEQ